ncbi:polysaccharide lyase 8 family protein [Isoptericola sp. BMS4]|uniref:polysaccharide lyase 8 family protein n=1 Tax=Isoptericola sp. BMS4 TaxID=2527875 RepID=UPI00141DA1E4|nr:polysaccharide lyase 8 family protein [Isoptericola sp. BMS4]
MFVTTRRTVLRLGGTAFATALLADLGRPALATPLAAGATGTEALRARWVDALTGRANVAASPATFADAIGRLDRAADGLLAQVSPTPTRFFTSHDWSVGATEIARSNEMRMNYVRLETLAVAWATPGSRHEASAEVLDTITTGLAHLHSTIYHPGTSWWGNWWSWLIGVTKPLANVMAIVRDELSQAEVDDYCAAMDHFLPDRDPRLQIHPSGVQESEGANRVDICQAYIVRSIVQPDPTLLRAAVDALSPTWQYVTEGNGFYRDGSFVQHSTIPYTGTYGLVLLGGLAELFALLAGSSFDVTDPSRSNVTGVVEASFAPFVFNGQMMDAVRGRAVSRYAERSIDDGNLLIEHVLRLAEAADPDTAARWRGLCRQWIESDDAATITDTTNIVRLALVTELLHSSVPAVADPTGPRHFPAMDRLVHRGADGTWAMAVAMCSDRIAWHEGTGAENFEGVRTSQGMTYLYLADDDDHYDDHFWATSDLTAPPGTTVDLTPLPPNPEGTWGEGTPDNEWTGGAVLGDAGLAAMHLVGPGGTGLTARKVWITLPDRVVALGSDIATGSDGEVRTVVEHRNLGESPRTLLVDGAEVTTERTVSGARWAHLDGVGGYLVLEGGADLVAGVEERAGTWQRNNTSTAAGTGETRRRQYGTLALTHGAGAAVAGARYAYAVLPGADATQTADAARSPGVEVLRNDDGVQAVRAPGHLLAAVFWAAGAVEDVSTDGPACVLVRDTPGVTHVAVSEPTRARDLVVLRVAGTAATRVRGTDAARVTLERDGSGVRLTIDTRDTAGTTIEFVLVR